MKQALRVPESHRLKCSCHQTSAIIASSLQLSWGGALKKISVWITQVLTEHSLDCIITETKAGSFPSSREAQGSAVVRLPGTRMECGVCAPTHHFAFSLLTLKPVPEWTVVLFVGSSVQRS